MSKFMNSTNLKIIGIVTMFIDHFAAILYWSDYRFYLEDLYSIDFNFLYILMRLIGRIAFPIFAFLIAQGFHYTKDKKKYVVRLSIFAIISEIPFDLAFSQKFLEFSHQNVFFTLTIGLLAIIFFDNFKQQKNLLLAYISLIFFSLLALGLMTDYNFIGVLMIFYFYNFNYNKKSAVIGFTVLNTIMFLVEIFMVIYSDYPFPTQIAGYLALVFILNYNYQKGRNIKYLFYIFYPGHILLIYLLKILL